VVPLNLYTKIMSRVSMAIEFNEIMSAIAGRKRKLHDLQANVWAVFFRIGYKYLTNHVSELRNCSIT
jgi:hypothetical protein